MEIISVKLLGALREGYRGCPNRAGEYAIQRNDWPPDEYWVYTKNPEEPFIDQDGNSAVITPADLIADNWIVKENPPIVEVGRLMRRGKQVRVSAGGIGI